MDFFPKYNTGYTLIEVVDLYIDVRAEGIPELKNHDKNWQKELKPTKELAELITSLLGYNVHMHRLGFNWKGKLVPFLKKTNVINVILSRNWTQAYLPAWKVWLMNLSYKMTCCIQWLVHILMVRFVSLIWGGVTQSMPDNKFKKIILN